MYDDVLIATDGSDPASRATQQGLSIADDVGARVHALSVADVPAIARDSTREQVRADCREFVDAVADEATARDVSVTTAVRDGRPHHEILAVADEHDVDLLILGTHGRTGVRRWLLGNVAMGVVRGARRPVLTVGPRAVDVPRTVDRLLVATNGRPGAAAAVGHAIELAAAFDATLHALSVVDDADTSLSVVVESFEKQAEAATDAVASRAAEQDVEVVTAIERGRPHEEITEYVGDRGIDLAVVGTETLSSMERFAVGSVSQRVAATSPAPVVTVRRTN
ncbi:universal stress protein [Halosolutus amylolyticus]|uniref:Universal stress protein n=1 Tax=Halosolutus amylolyticus TaxID=2932267 RepID=A0ABD5PTA4_9EURY|nr:universal stress protein [Halosolutus amylolyticus]